MSVTKRIVYFDSMGYKVYETYCLSCGKIGARVYNPFAHAWNGFVLWLHKRAGCPGEWDS